MTIHTSCGCININPITTQDSLRHIEETDFVSNVLLDPELCENK